MMKILIESHVPGLQGVFEPYAQVAYVAPEDITPATVKDADAIIVRTRTRCDRRLLAGSCCRIVATATIGVDHIDQNYCREHGITVANAPGCNAPAVAQYVLASAQRLLGNLSGRTIGIVGAGHVGSITARWATAMGMTVLLNDPPLEAAGGRGYVSLEEIGRSADVVTLHTPLTRTGDFPTYHLADDGFCDLLRRCPVLINAARGSVAATDALLRAKSAGKVSHLVIDCWEGEPQISLPLLEAASIATPHIAGYSIEGKQRASAMAANAVGCALGLDLHLPVPEITPVEAITPCSIAKYDPMADDAMLRANPSAFETLRNHYALRPEPQLC